MQNTHGVKWPVWMLTASAGPRSRQLSLPKETAPHVMIIKYTLSCKAQVENWWHRFIVVGSHQAFKIVFQLVKASLSVRSVTKDPESQWLSTTLHFLSCFKWPCLLKVDASLTPHRLLFWHTGWGSRACLGGVCILGAQDKEWWNNPGNVLKAAQPHTSISLISLANNDICLIHPHFTGQPWHVTKSHVNGLVNIALPG